MTEQQAAPAKKVRKNFYFVLIQFDDGTMTMSSGFTSQSQINKHLESVDQSMIADVKVIFGQEKKSQKQTRIKFI